ncbi:uncharacterized protein M6B38_407430 [Iris pallida]|uniref:ABC transporter domain-containing protein n=1 Tax=Iris pallida TaxID=29817 RepID=A0AAX6FQ28_IRIPA|nr:uncharacterized protein M6B38_407430 [Iris pallida]
MRKHKRTTSPTTERTNTSTEARIRLLFWTEHTWRSGMSICVGTHLIPHPAKVDKGGEDAFLVDNYNGGVLAIADGVSGMALLLGPPSSGKTTLLLALAGKLEPNLKTKGEVTYNGYKLNEFVPQKTATHISQYDVHMGEMTVKETRLLG